MKTLDEGIITLMRMKLDILKLKANHYSWACETPTEVKIELEKMLKEIDEHLNDVNDLKNEDKK